MPSPRLYPLPHHQLWLVLGGFRLAHHVVAHIRFIEPAIPVAKDTSPAGPDWLHEVKFDGWRVQVHKHAGAIRLYSRNGAHLSERFPTLRDACTNLPDCIIDGELVACGVDGRPDFPAIRGDHDNLCIWCFDLLSSNGRDIRRLALVERREMLKAILDGVGDGQLRYSEEFSDPVGLLEASAGMGLEGVVSKKRHGMYRSGIRSEWVKVKTAQWKQVNAKRFDQIQKGRDAT